MKRAKERLHKVVVIGATPAGIAATNKLGELGIPVTLVDTETDMDRKLSEDVLRLKSGVAFNHAHRPGLIRILRNPSIKCILPAHISSIRHSHQGFRVGITRDQTFVDPEKCILCGRCIEVCPVQDCSADNAITINSRQSLPGRAVIDKRRVPLCRESCPLGVNVQGYVALVKEGRFKEALGLIREKNILPGICGRICTHPCESVCRRSEHDGAVAIRDIKRFLADYETDSKVDHAPKHQRSEKIAIIGSGPAGLAAAAEMARQGCVVTIYEKEKQAGGLLRYGIGPHRLPRNILDKELAYVQGLGVEIITDHVINLNGGLSELTQKFDAVILAAGSWADRKLGVEGENLEGVFGCIEFLAQLYRGDVTSLKEKVAVIGDGSAAYDLARVLCRIGADVSIVSWFDKEKIPADPEEIVAATEEGIPVVDNTRVVGFEGKNGRFERLKCRPTQAGKPDASGIAWPVVIKDSKAFFLEFDRAFVAIGQTGALGSNGKDQALAVSDNGLIVIDDQFKTNMDKVYAAGDAASGASSVVHAMAQGRAAALRVLDDICGITSLEDHTVRSIDRDFTPVPSDLAFVARAHMMEKNVAERKLNFDEVALGLTEDQAVEEAQRCLQCGVCSDCMECLSACDAIGAINHDEPAEDILEHAGVIIIADPDIAPSVRGDDIIRAYGPATSRTDVSAMMTRGFAAAARAMVLLSNTSQRQKGRGMSFSPPEADLANEIKIGVFACRCNDSLGWHPAMDRFLEDLLYGDFILHTESVVSACTPEGTAAILKTVREKGITRLVLASCVCCPLNFVCSSCTDQRSRLKHALFNATGISRSMVMTCNIRNEALSDLAHDPDMAVEKFSGLIRRSVRRARTLKPFSSPARNYNFTTAVIGESEAAIESALTLADSGIDAYLFGSRDKALDGVYEHANLLSFKGSRVKNISGSLGAFQLTVAVGEKEQQIQVGAVILGEKIRGKIQYLEQEINAGYPITASMQKAGTTGIPFFYPGMTSVSGLFMADPPGIAVSSRQKGHAAAVLAAAIMPRGPRQHKGFTVTVNADQCRGCGRCIAKCPYRAITMQKNDIGGWYAVVDEALCKGCGNCIPSCPSNAADSPFRDRIFLEKTLEEILVN
ncbi:MAG: FAD-dependent oxidoreductase [Desulfobacteraceae bacterium]|jgi:NADPH-dependent glutamate synthase beta subunit-like oxidoreductase/NAD-dependent dihydropyrimidine dehydrogenase PreA subunit|nr:FAD-dependent oxidoreductase [Desulfobacteraceae bacterium]